ncbi:hypothetical protein BCR32DRAFT_290469 [Anaeromyces robustus]|uniref:Dickkopf N-terminal cysteine-rich domain-containing protein n=1 Tax=Anaeromyces robustus TaxID=1754192 RepID=A0A1Y1XJ63_9FUNG|nr:hypothetical protein BCR32DRAFT_290469 [Anaeromyces robustus]|eukprot:ORX85799.1 hypothetical protein BCR32DRAFT_290469 [Anaeromyces robustus]
MKIYLFSLLTTLLITLKMSNGKEIQISHQKTKYNIKSFNEPTEINSVSCETDKDCLSNSCENGKCNFYFLCSEDEKENCISLTFEAWKSYDINEDSEDSEDSDESDEIKVYPNKYRPIIRSCYKEELHTAYLAKLLLPTCETEKCNKNDDCLFGNCFNSTCITETPIYKCNSKDLDCKKANFIQCADDEECYSGHCISGFCLQNAYNYTANGVIKSFIIAILIRLSKSLISFTHGKIKKAKANKEEKVDIKKNKKAEIDKNDEHNKKEN